MASTIVSVASYLGGNSTAATVASYLDPVAAWDASTVDFLQYYWTKYLTSNFDEKTLTVWVSFVMLLAVYTATSLPYFIIDYYEIPFFQKWKVQGHRRVTWPDIKKCINRLLFNHFALALPLSYLSFPILEARGITAHGPLPSVFEIIGRVILYLIIEDVWFFFGHWALHTDWGYKNIHHIHHEFDIPIGMASSYAHPVEFLFLGVGTFLGPMILGGGHLISMWIWTIVRQIEAIECHCGFDFPWALHNILPIYCGADFHDYHHFSYAGNYASIFKYLDWIFGTDAKYRAFKAKGSHPGLLARTAGLKKKPVAAESITPEAAKSEPIAAPVIAEAAAPVIAAPVEESVVQAEESAAALRKRVPRTRSRSRSSSRTRSSARIAAQTQ